MNKPERVGDLEITQDMKFQEKMWKLERAGWYLILTFLIAAFLGFLGPGPFSKTKAGNGNGSMEVEYLRFGRNQTPTSFTLTLAKGLTETDGKIRLKINREFLESVEISQIGPQPAAVTAGGKDNSFEFNVEEGQPVHIKFYYEFEEPGIHELTLKVKGAGYMSVKQIIYP